MNPTPLSTLLTFPFKDPAWFKKLLILALVILLSGAIPILPLILATGYLARIIHRMVVDKSKPSLPEWDDMVGIFKDGWKPFAAAVTFMLPVFALFIVVWLLVIVPTSVAPMFQMENYDNFGVREILVIASSFLGVGGFAVAMLVALVVTFVLPAAAVHGVVRQEYAAAFCFKEWWPILAANLSGFIIAYAVTFGLNLVFGFLVQILFFTILLCCLVPLLIFGFSSYFYVVFAALFADAYRVGAEKASRAGAGGVNQPSEPALEDVAKPEPEPTPERAPESTTESAPVKEAEKPSRVAKAAESMPTLIQEPAAEPEPKPASKPARKTPRKSPTSKPEIDTIKLPPSPPVPGVDTITLPPPASVPGIDTVKLPPEEGSDQTSQSELDEGDGQN